MFVCSYICWPSEITFYFKIQDADRQHLIDVSVVSVNSVFDVCDSEKMNVTY